MAVQSSETIPRPSDLSNRTDPAVLYAVSYLVTRAIIGILGVLLPVAFIIGEAYLSGSVKVRGSLSAYYHTSMRDVFVAGLCVIGFFLITYLSGETKTRDFRLSLLAGVAVLFVVFFPTKRPDLAPDAPLCGVTPLPRAARRSSSSSASSWWPGSTSPPRRSSSSAWPGSALCSRILSGRRAPGCGRSCVPAAG